VAYENRDELWLYSRGFGRALQRIPLGDQGWWSNRGIEGAATHGNSLILLHEAGDRLLRMDGRERGAMRIAGARTNHSDAVAIGERQWLVVERQLTPFGFRNFLAVLEWKGGQYRLGRRFKLPVGPSDNVEAVAVERLAGGGRRLWLMTDDNFQPLLMRTVLVALDVPASGVHESGGED
jgi:hypothetical protein